MSLGAMQDWSMRISHVIDHAAREAPDREIVTHWADGSETRTDWAGIRRDAKKMSQALQALGLEDDADFEAVKKSWRMLAKENHPDVKPGDTQAAARFQTIQAAYEVLRAAEERRTWKPRGAVD